MKSDIIFGVLLGTVVGATVATFYKPAQNMVKKGTEMVKNEASNVLKKVKNDDWLIVVKKFE